MVGSQLVNWLPSSKSGRRKGSLGGRWMRKERRGVKRGPFIILRREGQTCEQVVEL